MNPITHLLLGWMLANAVPVPRKARGAICLAAVIPDVDGLGILAELATRHQAEPILWWTRFHHVLAHNLTFGLVFAAGSLWWISRATSRQPDDAGSLEAQTSLPGTWEGGWRLWLWLLLSFHVHLLGDVVGARGPDGYQWPIPYLWPWSETPALSWEAQWAINAWPNILLTVVCLVVTFYLAWKKGYSPLELLSTRADREVVMALRARFPHPRERA